MTKIRTLTLNPVIDLGSGVSSIQPNQKLRCDTPSFEAGGGGVNVSRALKRLGQESTAIFPLGGDLGGFYQHLLEAEDIVCKPIEIKARMRRINTNIREKESGDQYRFCMPGMEMTEKEKVSTVGSGDSAVAGLVLGRIQGESHLTSAQWAVAAGSATAKTPGTHLLSQSDFDNLRGAVHKLSQENPHEGS